MFWQNNAYFVVFFLCLATMFLQRKKWEKRYRYVLLYTVLTMIVVYNPLFAQVAYQFVFTNTSEYVRLYLLMPVLGIMSLVGTEIIIRAQKYKLAIVVLLVGGLILMGNSFFQTGEYIKPFNVYKIADETPEMVDAILEDAGGEAQVLIDTNGVPTINLFNARGTTLVYGIRQYTTKVKVAGNLISNDEYLDMTDEEASAYREGIEKAGCQYIICKENDLFWDLKEDGLKVLKQTGEYVILKVL